MPRGVHGNHRHGSAHHRWNQRKMDATTGYIKIRVGRGHPLADPNGYAYEHLVVWCAAGNSRPGKGWILHHKNEDKHDNRIENLELVSRADHNRHHNAHRARDAQGRLLPKAAGRLLDGRTWDEFPQVREVARC